MKCEGEKTYTQAGKCPVCGMDLDGIETKNK
jgi:rRNA maturation protein Nop10